MLGQTAPTCRPPHAAPANVANSTSVWRSDYAMYYFYRIYLQRTLETNKLDTEGAKRPAMPVGRDRLPSAAGNLTAARRDDASWTQGIETAEATVDGYCRIDDMPSVQTIKGFTKVTPHSENALKCGSYDCACAQVRFTTKTRAVVSSSVFKHKCPGVCFCEITVIVSMKRQLEPLFLWFREFRNRKASFTVAQKGLCATDEVVNTQTMTSATGSLTDRPNTRANHALTVVGYGERYGETYFIVKNSWGQDWGSGGYMLMSAKNNNCLLLNYPYYVEV
ncbi:Cathepsin K [Eumeta japonica]|uniref:Cathepsin K n=1 Tax=Eumeta variegata TaxID=151549 RepID=A0A4C1VQ55_EUMVA|nr:Cathepsin K [Eumeta japonica]